jgi:FkbM family methyltransferase
MKSLLKYLLQKNKRYFISFLCRANNISLDYRLNKRQIAVLLEVFADRVYSSYFPFYQNAIIVDIGAHYGYFSLFAAKNTSADSVIYAVEPDIDNYNALCKNITQNRLGNVRPLQCAIGGKSETAKLYKGRSPNNSLLKDYALSGEGRYEEIEVKTMKQVINEHNIQKIDFLKMDCEGSEYAIIESMQPEIFGIIKTISLEFHDLKHEKYNGQFIVNTLRKNNFVIVRYDYSKTSMGLNYGKIVATKMD